MNKHERISLTEEIIKNVLEKIDKCKELTTEQDKFHLLESVVYYQTMQLFLALRESHSKKIVKEKAKIWLEELLDGVENYNLPKNQDKF